VNAEGGGLFVVQNAGGLKIGGGGNGRLLLGRGLDPYWTVLGGAEFGGAALFEQTATAARFPIQFTVAVPLAVRHHDLTWHYEAELAPLAFFTATDGTPSWGGRVALLFGVSTLRIRRIMPWVGIGVALEQFVERDARNDFRQVKAGLRLGFDWDPP
jgi:hypothetical protein